MRRLARNNNQQPHAQRSAIINKSLIVLSPLLRHPLRLFNFSHLLRLGQTHGGEDGRGDITENTLVALLEAPTLRVVGHQERHLVCGVAGLGLAVRELHLLGVAVVSSDEKDVALLLTGLEDLANGLVGSLATDNSGLVDTGTLDNLVGDAIGRHLRGKIVGGDGLVGGDQILGLVTGLEMEGLLNTTVEEEGNPLGEDVAHVLRLEGNLEGIVALVLGHGDKGLNLGVLEVGERRSVDIAEKLGDLTDTVRSVVEEEDSVIELVSVQVTAALVSSLDGSNGVLRGLTLTVDKTLKGNLEAVPALVAVHGKVSTDNGTDLTNANLLGCIDEFLHVTGAGLGVGITAITEEVDEDLGHTKLLGGLEEGVEVGRAVYDMTYHTTMRDETAEVQAAVASSSILEGLLDNIVLAQLAVLDGLVDSDNVLPHNTASSDIQVSDLRVTHETLRESHRQR
ncbi:hypothetical protein HG530_009016 [Fusarium avenaceum]|nr:hypothetical protein HG530_009016 [Fusarium avenaceum]